MKSIIRFILEVLLAGYIASLLNVRYPVNSTEFWLYYIPACIVLVLIGELHGE